MTSPRIAFKLESMQKRLELWTSSFRPPHNSNESLSRIDHEFMTLVLHNVSMSGGGVVSDSAELASFVLSVKIVYCDLRSYPSAKICFIAGSFTQTYRYTVVTSTFCKVISRDCQNCVSYS